MHRRGTRDCLYPQAIYCVIDKKNYTKPTTVLCTYIDTEYKMIEKDCSIRKTRFSLFKYQFEQRGTIPSSFPILLNSLLEHPWVLEDSRRVLNHVTKTFRWVLKQFFKKYF